ncbi:hypothetical protein DV515_00011381 [Chloebia gouldiae]|uniref:Uncharacterized protein n=1 Tax=Chloebia gouldiae TaxID=44316 RepID=A0A3L8S6G9_CHLGU|nr:hypothetical protein DV515_00011381 [Chloebia gouldiae]
MFAMYLLCQKQKAVALLMKQNLKNQGSRAASGSLRASGQCWCVEPHCMAPGSSTTSLYQS